MTMIDQDHIHIKCVTDLEVMLGITNDHGIIGRNPRGCQQLAASFEL